MNNCTVIWLHTSLVGNIQLPDANELHVATDIDNQMYWKIESKSPQDVILMENDQPDEELDLASHRLISVLLN